MAKFKLKSALKGYKKLFGMTAEVYNENGDLLDSVDIKNDKNISFKFDKDNAFQGSKKADLTIKLIDNNGDDRNLSRKGGRLYDLDSDEQTFTQTISTKKKGGKSKLRPSTEQLDTQSRSSPRIRAPLIASTQAPSTAETTDASSVSYA